MPEILKPGAENNRSIRRLPDVRQKGRQPHGHFLQYVTIELTNALKEAQQASCIEPIFFDTDCLEQSGSADQVSL
ncbi:MAG: hypothetical protein C5B47_02360 [Verrucomicrobia bacterium]|nr:MAG: hypothetical protein C5B47_02360 [Verrucomicrobiota bacterium]